MNDAKKLYGLGTSRHTVEIVKEAFRKDLDRNQQEINFISAIGKSKECFKYDKPTPEIDPTTKKPTGKTIMVETTVWPEITLFVDKRTNPEEFAKLKSAPRGAVCEVVCALRSKNFPDKKGDKTYDAFYLAPHVIDITVTEPSS